MAVPAVMAEPPAREVQARSEEGYVQAGGRKSPRDGGDWYDRGMQHHRDEEYDEAIAAFKKAIELGQKEEAASYNIACGYALKGDADHAFEWLDRAMDAGFDVSQYIGQDDDLESLESDPRFAKYKQKAREARSQLKRKQVEHKLARYEQLTRSNPKNGAAWYKLGYELYELGEHDRAAKAFQQAAALHYSEDASLYNTACMLSLAGDRRGSLDYLERAILAGFGSADKLREDEDLDNIRSEPRYRELLKLAEELEMPHIEQWGWNKYARVTGAKSGSSGGRRPTRSRSSPGSVRRSAARGSTWASPASRRDSRSRPFPRFRRPSIWATGRRPRCTTSRAPMRSSIRRSRRSTGSSRRSTPVRGRE